MDADKKARLDRRFLLLFETAKRSLLAADALSKQIIRDLENFEPDFESRTEIGERAAPTLIAAVAFVDFAFRFKEVVASLPFIRKDEPAMKRLASELKSVETTRHHLQHMRNELSREEEVDYALLGALSWAKGFTTYILYFSQPGRSTTPSVAFDTQEMKWVATHTFIVKNDSIDIDRTVAQMHSAFDWIRNSISVPDPSILELKWGATHAAAVKFEFRSIQPPVP